jgi:hypothetical protein
VRFNATDLRLLRTTPPVLTEAPARARTRAQFEKSAIEDIELILLPAKNGSQPVTVWTALVITMGPEELPRVFSFDHQPLDLLEQRLGLR